jgi:copper chaperone CopZ
MRTGVLTLVAGLALAVWASPAAAQEPVDPQPQQDADLVLAVEGFSCEMCAAKLERTLRKMEAAEAVVAAPWDEGTVSIWLNADAEVEDEVLAAAVKDSGFVLKKVRRNKAEREPGS